jgi:hypothetical protein
MQERSLWCACYVNQQEHTPKFVELIHFLHDFPAVQAKVKKQNKTELLKLSLELTLLGLPDFEDFGDFANY